MNALAAVAREWWRELFNGHPFPTDAVKENLAVEDDAIYMAHRLRKNPTDYNRKVLHEAGRLLGV